MVRTHAPHTNSLCIYQRCALSEIPPGKLRNTGLSADYQADQEILHPGLCLIAFLKRGVCPIQYDLWPRRRWRLWRQPFPLRSDAERTWWANTVPTP